MAAEKCRCLHLLFASAFAFPVAVSLIPSKFGFVIVISAVVEENLFNKKLNPQIRLYLILIGKLKVYAYITFVYTHVSTLGSGILQAC